MWAINRGGIDIVPFQVLRYRRDDGFQNAALLVHLPVDSLQVKLSKFYRTRRQVIFSTRMALSDLSQVLQADQGTKEGDLSVAERPLQAAPNVRSAIAMTQNA